LLTVTRIVPKNELNAEESNNTIIELLSQIHPGGSTGLLEPGEESSQPTYAYGELVDMLCARGQHLVALELETLWNRLLSVVIRAVCHPFVPESYLSGIIFHPAGRDEMATKFT
jgi:hypothetical protein